MCVVKGAGHACSLTHPNVVNPALIDFLRRATWDHDEDDDREVCDEERWKAAVEGARGGNGGEGEPAAVVATDVYEVTGASFASDVGAEAGEGTSLALFPRISEQNWCYLCVDARRRHVTVWYHAFVPYW